MSLFNISVVIAAVVLLIGVVAIVRGRPFIGFLAVLLAIAIAGFGYWETTSAASPSDEIAPMGRINRASTEA